MNGAKKLSLLAAAFMAAFAVCRSPARAGEPGSSSAVLLRFAPGPRGVGMGEAYTAVTADAYSAWWNPAGLASVEVPELAATHNASFQDVAHQYLSVAYPLRYGSTLDFNITRLSVAPFQGYDASGLKTEEVESSGMVFGAAYARTLYKDEIERPVLNVGAGLKYVTETLDSVSASAPALDLGAIYHIRPSRYWMKGVPAQEFRLGAALRNLGPGLKYDVESFPLPMSLSLGAAWISHPWGAHELTLAMDNVLSNDDAYVLALGAEYFMYQILSFRAGFRTGQETGSGVRLGVGFRLSFADLDYSMSPFGELGAMHRLGLAMRFGTPRAVQPLAGEVSRAKEAKLIAPKAKIEKLDLFAKDFLALAEKDLAARRYVSALENIKKAFNLEPGLRDGAWGKKEKRLAGLESGLKFGEIPERQRLFAGSGAQPDTAHEAMLAYVEGRDLKALLLAHAALGEDMRGNAVFEELLYVISDLSRIHVRRDEILPRRALINEKLKKTARAFYIQQFDTAARECEEIVLLDENSHLGWTRLGSAYHMLGDKDRARAAFAKALELRPDDRVTREFMRAQGWDEAGR